MPVTMERQGSGDQDVFHGFRELLLKDSICPSELVAPLGNGGGVPVPEVSNKRRNQGGNCWDPLCSSVLPVTGEWEDFGAQMGTSDALWDSARGQLSGTRASATDMYGGSKQISVNVVPKLSSGQKVGAPAGSRISLEHVHLNQDLLIGSSTKWNERVDVMCSESSHSSAGSARLIREPRSRAAPIKSGVSRKRNSNRSRGSLLVIDTGTKKQAVPGTSDVGHASFDLNVDPEEGVADNEATLSIGTMGVQEECIAGAGIDLMEFVEAAADPSTSWSDDSDGETEASGEVGKNDIPHNGDQRFDLNTSLTRMSGFASGQYNEGAANDIEGQASSSGSSHGVEPGVEVSGPKHKRVYNPEGPPQRDPVPGRKSALEQALMKFADRSSNYIIDPAVGTEFDSWQEAYEYYNLYSWECGFGIRCGKKTTSTSQKFRGVDPKDRYVRALELLCCCAGKPEMDTRVSSRTNCVAMLRLHRTDDHGWVVVEHRDKHNHPLSESCGEKRQWPSHKHIDKHTRDLIRILRENNIGVTKIYSILGSFFGSMQNVPTTKRTLRNVCQGINREQAEDDIRKTLEVFREFRETDPGFQYSVEADEDGRIKSLMWTNARSRMQYAHFGDVVTFDTTYRTNLYDMPFGLFVGVNNHFQSVLFGGVLLTEETIPSFKWVFKEFVSLMGGKLPKTVLTDQCRAMEVAIFEEWEGVQHRWCKWHVLRRVRECVGTKYTGNKEFRQKFHKMLNEMLTQEEFEIAWKALLDEYGLSKNPFLQQVYEVRHKWAKPFFKGVFCAKQTSTQRSESANHMVKGLVPPGSPIHHFVRQYAKLQYAIDDNENYEERRTKLFTRDLSMGGPLVHQASKVYTFKVFGMFCKLKMESEFYFVNEISVGTKYLAVHYNVEKVQRWCKGEYVVHVDEERTMFSCECGLFEHFGLPCSHSIRVMISLGLRSIPESMILLRWTKKARLVLPAHLAQYGEPNPTLLAKTYRHSALFIAALELVQLGDSNVECFHIAMSCILEAKLKLLECSKEKDGMGLAEKQAGQDHTTEPQNVGQAGDQNQGDQFGDDLFPLRVPNRKRKAGRPSNARDKPGYEQLSKRTRRCKTCRAADHRSDRCPNREAGTVRPRGPPTCSGCGLAGHTVVNCGKQFQAAVAASVV